MSSTKGPINGIYKAIGAKIRVQRKQAHLNQTELGSRVSLSRTSVSSIEAGTQRVTVEHLFHIAHALGCEPGSLLPKRSDVLSDLTSVVPLQSNKDDALINEILNAGVRNVGE